MAERVGQQFGQYRLSRFLGQGSFGEVYLGEHIYHNNAVAAVKVLQARLTAEDLKEFINEASTTFRLHHPHIVRLLDFGTGPANVPFLAMAYAPNGTLRQRYPKWTRLPLESIIAYVRPIASALQYAHDERLIHRDVKPENILLGPNEEVWLSDFGIVAVAHSTGSLDTERPEGTVPYMAPEQLRGKPRPASDQYALGVIVYEWLCGERPFGGTATEIAMQHFLEPPPSLREKVPAISPDVEQVVLTALAKDPKERFATVQAFAIALRQASEAAHPGASSTLSISSAQEAPPFPSPESSSLVLPTPAPWAGAGTSLPRQVPSAAQPAQQPPKRQPPLTEPPLAPMLPSPLTPSLPSSAAITPYPRPIIPSTSKDQNRQRMLNHVRRTWITGVLEHSLYGAMLIELGLKSLPTVLENPWRLTVQETALSARPLPAGTTIAQVYDEANGALLILGEPGAGKTTLLLALARDLLARAENNPLDPLPVVFNLSSWATKQQALTDWLIEELTKKYQVRRNLAASWVNNEQLLLLLDGLDEVAPAARNGCIQAINGYREAHPFVPVVVCSRRSDYLDLRVRLRLHSAVVIEPLTTEQMERYLESAGDQVAVLREAFQHDPDVQELARSPLMLNVLLLAYQGTPLETFSVSDSLQRKQRHIFTSYVERMLTRRSAQSCYSRMHICSWLTWLAQQMQQRHLTEFYLEHMQRSWLPTKWSRTMYNALNVLIFGLIVAPLAAAVLPITALVISLVVTTVAGLFMAQQEIHPQEILKWSWKDTWLWLLIALVAGLLVGLVGGILLRLVGGILLGLSVTLIIGLIVTLTVGLSGEAINEHMRTHPNQGIRSSGWNALRVGLIVGLAASLVAGLLAGLLAGPVVGAVVGLVAGLVVGLVFGFVFGGRAYLQHYFLRYVLWRSGGMPWHYARFLEYATERILLRKVGGGYMFVHRLLLDYFATPESSNQMVPPSPSDLSSPG